MAPTQVQYQACDRWIARHSLTPQASRHTQKKTPRRMDRRLRGTRPSSWERQRCLYLMERRVNIAGGRRRTDTTQPQSLMHRPTPWYKKAIEQHPADRQCAV
ncbi:hypothetical protein TcBrA4_0080590 [Trypanosoma cruzi]|nr:hypothetical protein TcBrA4_0080590 [Trypanosoma cruzi]